MISATPIRRARRSAAFRMPSRTNSGAVWSRAQASGAQRTGVSGAACQSRSTTSTVTRSSPARRASTSTSRWKRRSTKSAIMAGRLPETRDEPGFRLRRPGERRRRRLGLGLRLRLPDQGRRHRDRAVLGRQLLADPARHRPHERRDGVEQRQRLGGPRRGRRRHLVGAARGQAHHLALVAGHELGRDHADALGARPLLGQPPDHAAEEHRGARDPRLGLRRPAHLAGSGVRRRARPRSRLAAPRRPREHHGRDDREEAEGPGARPHRTRRARGRTRSRRGASRRSAPPRSRGCATRSVRTRAKSRRESTQRSNHPRSRTRSQGKTTTNRAPTTNQAVPPRSMPRGPSPLLARASPPSQ